MLLVYRLVYLDAVGYARVAERAAGAAGAAKAVVSILSGLMAMVGQRRSWSEQLNKQFILSCVDELELHTNPEIVSLLSHMATAIVVGDHLQKAWQLQVQDCHSSTRAIAVVEHARGSGRSRRYHQSNAIDWASRSQNVCTITSWETYRFGANIASFLRSIFEEVSRLSSANHCLEGAVYHIPSVDLDIHHD